MKEGEKKPTERRRQKNYWTRKREKPTEKIGQKNPLKNRERKENLLKKKERDKKTPIEKEGEKKKPSWQRGEEENNPLTKKTDWQSEEKKPTKRGEKNLVTKRGEKKLTDKERIKKKNTDSQLSLSVGFFPLSLSASFFLSFSVGWFSLSPSVSRVFLSLSLKIFVLWATHGLSAYGPSVPWVSLPAPLGVLSDAQAGWHRQQSANRFCVVVVGRWSVFVVVDVIVFLLLVLLVLICNWEYLHPFWTASAVQALSRHHSVQFVSRLVLSLSLFVSPFFFNSPLCQYFFFYSSLCQ